MAGMLLCFRWIPGMNKNGSPYFIVMDSLGWRHDDHVEKICQYLVWEACARGNTNVLKPPSLIVINVMVNPSIVIYCGILVIFCYRSLSNPTGSIVDCMFCTLCARSFVSQNTFWSGSWHRYVPFFFRFYITFSDMTIAR